MHKLFSPSRRGAVLAIIASLLLAACSKPDYTDHLGHSGRFSDHQGQWMIINYWATWCKPCIQEIPELNHFARSQASKAVIFGVDYDQNRDAALQAAIAKLQIDFAVLNDDPAQRLGYPRPQVLPTTLIFNPAGKLVHTLKGPQTQQTLLAAIASDAPIAPSNTLIKQQD